MSLTLTPQQAASIAQGAYRIQYDTVKQATSKFGGVGVKKDNFAVGDPSRFKGVSGPEFSGLASETGFGFIGEGTGQYQGHVLVATRGTNSLADFATDAKFGMSISSCGHIVHAGFRDTFKSFQPRLDEYFKNKNPAQIHCVGHSLGGALATLAASYLYKRTGSPIKLYTFGCPRVGSLNFGASLTKNLGAENIFRVHHSNDPIGMVPCFPYFHPPLRSMFDQDPAHRITQDGFISLSYHYMDSYILSVKNSSWSSMAAAARAEVNKPNKLEQWLNLASQSNSSVLMYSAKVFWMINECLSWIIEKSLKVVGGSAALVLTGGATLIDKLAWLLNQGRLLSIGLSNLISKLILVIFKFLGRSVKNAANITESFIRWVLTLLTNAISMIARRAMNAVNSQPVQIANKNDVDTPFEPKSKLG